MGTDLRDAELVVSALLDERADGTMADSFSSMPMQWSRQELVAAIEAIVPGGVLRRAAELLTAHPTGTVPAVLMPIVRGADDFLNGEDGPLATSPELAAAAVEQAEFACAAGLTGAGGSQPLVGQQGQVCHDIAHQTLAMAQRAATDPTSLAAPAVLAVAAFVLQLSAGRVVRDVQDLPGAGERPWEDLPRVYEARRRIAAFVPAFAERGGFSFGLLGELEANASPALAEGLL